MTEAEAVEELATGSASVAIQVLTTQYNWRWVPGSHGSGWSGPGAPFSYVQWGVDGQRSLVTNQKAFELQGGTSGSVSDLLGLLGGMGGPVSAPATGGGSGSEAPQTITDPTRDGEDPAGQPFDASGFLKGAGWVWVLLLVVALED